MSHEELALAAARHRLGLRPAEPLPALGLRLLADGNDEALALALADDVDGDAPGVAFERLCGALGMPLPGIDEALGIVAEAHVRAIAEGRVSPEAGVGRLIDEVVGDPRLARGQATGSIGEELGLERLIGTYHRYDDVRERPRDFDDDAIARLDRALVELAQSWLAADRPKRPGRLA